MWWLIKNILLLPFLPFRIAWFLAKGTDIGVRVTGLGGPGGSCLIPKPILALVFAILIYWGIAYGIMYLFQTYGAK